jgi:hypothetical protein
MSARLPAGVSARGLLVAVVVSTCIFAQASAVIGAQLPNPGITASANSHPAGDYRAANVFDVGGMEFATPGQGAGTPLSEDPANGTWINFDFGVPVTMDTFINRTRTSPPGFDVIEDSRLVFSDDPTFDASDPFVTFSPTGFAGAGLVQRFAPRTAQYVRWEVSRVSGQFNNTGSRQMFFMKTPDGLMPAVRPTVYNGSPAFNPDYALQNAANNNAGRDGSGNEYASQGQGAATFVDFDFLAPTPIAGFDFFNREQDVITTYDMVFSNTPDFSVPIETKNLTASPNGNVVNSEVFDPVTARYVRLQATSFVQSGNTGISEIIFYTPIPEPAAAGVMLVGALGLLRRRRA